MSTTAPTSTTTTPLTADVAPVRGRGARRSFLASVAIVLAAVTALLLAGPASAYTTTARSGVPVSPTIYQVTGAHYNIGSSVTGPMLKPWIFQSGPVVNRVSVSGAQSVRVAYTVDRWNGAAWVQVTVANGSTTIAAGQVSAKAPNLSVLPAAGSGYYRVRLSLTWTSQIGAVLGSMTVSMNQTGDYTCAAGTCTVGAGWVYVG